MRVNSSRVTPKPSPSNLDTLNLPSIPKVLNASFVESRLALRYLSRYQPQNKNKE